MPKTGGTCTTSTQPFFGNLIFVPCTNLLSQNYLLFPALFATAVRTEEPRRSIWPRFAFRTAGRTP